MAFFTVKKYKLFNVLYESNTRLEYGTYIGHLDIDKLNGIQEDILSKTPYNPEDWGSDIENILTTEYHLFLSRNLDLTTDDIKSYLMFIRSCSSIALVSYLMNIIDINKTQTDTSVVDNLSNLNKIWFREFIPEVTLKQITNNPYSELDWWKDSKVNWRISEVTLIPRTFWNFFKLSTFFLDSIQGQ